MTGRASRNKGKNGELEVVRELARYGFETRRTPNSGGLAIKGDLTSLNGGAAIPGWHIEVKRCERWNVPDWLRQAHADAGANVPLLVMRRSFSTRTDPTAQWHAVLPLDALLGLLADARDTGRLVA